jgi:hypothetical protein
MRAHPRIRKTVKWGGAAVTVLLVVVWVGSGKFAVLHHWTGGTSASVYRGRLYLWPGSGPIPPASAGFATRGPSDFGVEWWIGFGRPSVGKLIAIPLWWLVLPATVATSIAWRLDTLARRRARLNLCPKCGYDRTGLAGGAGAVCPECGKGAA